MLTARKVERTKTPGRYRDGLVRGLYLQISDTGARSWVLRFERHGVERMMGLGSASEFSLRAARERALAARRLLADGLDPLAAKHAAKAAAKAAEARRVTFREATQRYFDQNADQWRSASHRDQFMSSLRTDAFPIIGDMDVASIGLADVLRVIEPMWKTKAITADRVRSRIQRVLDWCTVRGHRPPGTNPAAWKNHLDQVLPPPRKVAPVQHHAAMGYRELPAFLAELRQEETVAARALEFLILTAARTGEVTGAVWNEIDLDAKTWIVPAGRMKSHREHRQPLADVVVDLLRALPREKGNPHVFVGHRPGAGLSRMALPHVMARMGESDVTVHGFRSSFSDWAHEQTAHSPHTIEISLAHNVGTETERAYRRTDMIAKRRKLMEAWASFVLSPPKATAANVVPIAGKR
jgi:integrase